ncbi:PrsW family glutamic-type intramembrane protease [Streptomyces sp. TLI_185]|uniref:PrsW family glutamic-type intramembrane protease n=1 Tax=Streptomyces sp. TLI_185 TaxID=2485151 RepID=UPI000F9AB46F|nr:PrsW family glutamic-type intramembrane protease [Streptomyces sp. TLI_185]RPF35942.1 protease prsW family protein [Streptomyces sp. TLI_185]
MTVLMMVAAVYGVVQLFVLSYPTRSVRLATVLLALIVGVYVCGTAAALLEVTYTRAIADRTGQSLVEVVNTTSFTTAPWVEELVKVSPLLLIGAYTKVRRQWGLADFTVLGAALGAGFGLLESLLRYSLDADRALARHGGWIVPDSLSPPYIPGPGQVLTSWLPSPAASLDLGQTGDITVPTFNHLAWTALAGLGVGLLWRAKGWVKPLAMVPLGASVAHHTLNNYVVQHPTDRQAKQWLEHLDGKLWLAPLLVLFLAMTVDWVCLRRGKRRIPGLLLSAEQEDGDSAAALIRYASRRLPCTVLIALRFVRLRRALCYAAVGTLSPALEPLRRAVADIATRIDATDHERAWRTADIRAHVRAARSAVGSRRRLVALIPCVLLLPSVLFLCVGSFKSTAGLQDYFTTGVGPKILLGFAMAALVWIAWQSATLLRTWRETAAHPLGEQLAAHRLRLSSALASATIGTLLLWRSTGPAGPEGRVIPVAHLLDALDKFLAYVGFALLLLSVLALFPPGAGLAFAGITVSGEGIMVSALAARLGAAGIALMAAGAVGGGAGGGGGGSGPGANPPPAQQGSASGDAIGGHRTASGIAKWAREQGWTETQTENGPPKFIDENGIVRVTLKQGSSRAPGSGMPHVEIRNAQGERIDPTGNLVARKSPGNHTSIIWDLP